MTTEEIVETVEVAKESLDAVADNIATLAKVATKMLEGGLKEETIILLLHDHSKVGKRDIKSVLYSLKRLGYYLED
jgi:hypothetical protein